MRLRSNIARSAEQASKQALELEINDEDKRVDRNHFQSLQDPKLQDLETDFHPSGVVLEAERKKNRSTPTDLKIYWL